MPPKTSLWRALLGATGLGERATANQTLAGIEAQVAGTRLPPLVLPAAAAGRRGSAGRYGVWPWLGGLAAMAGAVVAVMVHSSSGGDGGLRMKGGAQVTVWWEREGKTQVVKEGERLWEGDRVRAEVSSVDAGVAYWLAIDSGGRALVDADFVRKSALPLSPNIKAAFAQSLTLTGPAVGETLLVIVCKAGGMDGATIAAYVPAEGRPLAAQRLPQTCAVKRTRLR
jgi:hypothetical protein